MAFVIRASSGREPMRALCREFEIARSTGYEWKRRLAECASLSELGEHSRRPHHSPRKTAAGIEQQVVALRKEFGWGARKLQLLLAEKNVRLPESTINRILARNGLVDPQSSWREAPKRFERAEPNELWQMDFKGDYGVEEGRCYPLSLIDDHSRYLVGLYPLLRPDGELVLASLVEAFTRCGMPDAILTDHGTPWWSNTNQWGLTWVAVAVMNQNIRLCFSGFRHPQTQGKVERFHRTLKRDLLHHGQPKNMAGFARELPRFRQTYNEVRPHEALGMRRPAERYRPSARAYQSKPAEFPYPSDWTLSRLNTQGMLIEQGRRYFVCEALAGQVVAWQPLGPKWVVRYRNMYVREIDPKTGSTNPLVLPAG
jgi:transposase InsO family protein